MYISLPAFLPATNVTTTSYYKFRRKYRFRQIDDLL